MEGAGGWEPGRIGGRRGTGGRSFRPPVSPPPPPPRGLYGHGKPEKSWNFMTSFSRPGESWNLGVGRGKSWKLALIVQNK